MQDFLVFAGAIPFPDLITFRLATSFYRQLITDHRLLPQMREGVMQRGAGDLDNPAIRPVQLHDHEKRRRCRYGTDEQDDDDCRVAGCKQTEAREDDGEPEDQDHEEGHRE
jgi:hypothetical protein